MFEPNTLWAQIVERTDAAIATGHLISIPTHSEIVEDGGLRFLVRIAKNLEFKKRQRQLHNSTDTSPSYNPFLPYDENMYVTDISDSHICLLNKFNVVKHHILIVTRRFESQGRFLTYEDFLALWTCMFEFDGLGFYNAGRLAGASQTHKHLQMIPLSTALDGDRLPLEKAIEKTGTHSKIFTSELLPFKHAFIKITPDWLSSPEIAAKKTLESYLNMLAFTDIACTQKDDSTGPYNLLLTRNWMFLAARSKESFQSISINALGFAGSFFVRNRTGLHVVKKTGPLTILKNVAVSH